MRNVEEWRSLLRSALREAMRARQRHAMSALRSALAAIDNAEAPDAALAPAPTSGPIAGAVDGLGAGEIARIELTSDQLVALLQRDIQERRDAAASYLALGRDDEAATLHQQADLLDALLHQQP